MPDQITGYILAEYFLPRDYYRYSNIPQGFHKSLLKSMVSFHLPPILASVQVFSRIFLYAFRLVPGYPY